MEIRKYRAFDTSHVLIYGGIGAAILVGLIGVLAVGAPAPAMVAAGLVFLADCFINYRLFSERLRYQKSIWYYTPQGSKVIPEGAKPYLNMTDINSNIQIVVDWFSTQFPDRVDVIQNFLNGGTLSVEYSNEPMKHPLLSFTVRGLTSGNNSRALYQPKDGGRDFMAIVRHEFGHQCLFAIGVPDHHHHDYMVNIGFPDA